MNYFSKNNSKYYGFIFCCLNLLACFAIGCAKNSLNANESGKQQTLESDKALVTALAAPLNTRIVVFNGGNESIYHSFRIPSIIKTKNKTLVAFAEGRRWSPSDYGESIEFNKFNPASILNGSTEL